MSTEFTDYQQELDIPQPATTTPVGLEHIQLAGDAAISPVGEVIGTTIAEAVPTLEDLGDLALPQVIEPPEAPAPVAAHVPNVYTLGEYRFKPETSPGTPVSAEASIVDISCRHSPENAPVIAAAVQGKGCDVVALEIAGLSPEQVEEYEALFGTVTEAGAQPQALEDFQEKAPPGFVTQLITELHGSGAEIKIIDSPEGAAGKAIRQSAQQAERAGVASLHRLEVEAAKEHLGQAAQGYASELTMRDQNMAKQITTLAEREARQEIPRTLAVVKGVDHSRTLDMVPGVSRVDVPVQAGSLRTLDANPLDWAIQAHMDGQPPHIIGQLEDRVIISRYFSAFGVSKADANLTALHLSPQHVAATIDTVRDIAATPERTLQEKMNALGGFLFSIWQEMRQANKD